MTAKRIQRKRTKGWRMPENTVYVGRPTKWGNPFTGKNAVEYYHECLLNNIQVYAYAGEMKASEAFTSYQYDRFKWMSENLNLLKAKDLACWCPLDKPCHADVLLKLANK